MCRLLLVLLVLILSLPAGAKPGALRVLKVRGASLLIELAGVRVAVNPRFSTPPLPGVLFEAVPPALEPADVGRLDVVLVTDRWLYDARVLAELDLEDASCLVPDEGTAKRFRHAGAKKVRVVRAGDVVTTQGTRIEVSPTGADLDRVGFHLSRAGRTVWHAGHPPPLDVDALAGRFAKGHRAELVVVPGDEVWSRPGLVSGVADARLLAELSQARFFLTHDEDARPTAALAFAVETLFAAPRPREVQRSRARFVHAEPGVWYRIARPSGAAP